MGGWAPGIHWRHVEYFGLCHKFTLCRHDCSPDRRSLPSELCLWDFLIGFCRILSSPLSRHFLSLHTNACTGDSSSFRSKKRKPKGHPLTWHVKIGILGI